MWPDLNFACFKSASEVEKAKNTLFAVTYNEQNGSLATQSNQHQV